MKTHIYKSNYIVFGLPLLLIAFALILVRSNIFLAHPQELSVALTLDMIITIPALYAVLIWNNERIPRYTILSVFGVCMLLAGFVVPTDYSGFLVMVRGYVLPFIEVVILFFLVIKIRKVMKKMKAENQGTDFYGALETACAASFPARVASILVMEIAVIYYFFGMNRNKTIGEQEYTYYRKSGLIMTVYAFLGLIVVETLVVHIIAHKWNPTVAWVLTGLSAYSIMQIVALLRSLPYRLTCIDAEKKVIDLKFGFFSQAEIGFDDILSIEKYKRPIPEDGNIVQFSPLGSLDSHNILITCYNVQSLTGLYGRKKDFQRLAIFIDDHKTFIEDVQGVISVSDVDQM